MLEAPKVGSVWQKENIVRVVYCVREVIVGERSYYGTFMYVFYILYRRDGHKLLGKYVRCCSCRLSKWNSWAKNAKILD